MENNHLPEALQLLSMQQYTYDLPADRIAQFPLDKRDESKLLVYRDATITDSQFKHISNFIPEGAVLVRNETKVIAARLLVNNANGATIEVFCLQPILPAEMNVNLQTKQKVQWFCLVGNSKKWKPSEVLMANITFGNENHILYLKKLSPHEQGWIISFEWQAQSITFAAILSAMGHIPLPPYLHRPDEASDKTRYQTIYAKQEGSVAAPTAGLHFTAAVDEQLQNKGNSFVSLTLHVGAGTFLPVKTDRITAHTMHEELFEITVTQLEQLARQHHTIIAVGTTSLRTLESLYWLAYQIHRNPSVPLLDAHISQWEAYTQDATLTRQEALHLLLTYTQKNGLQKITGKTGILIAPGYTIRMADGIITNFHQPNSTLLLLIAALVGDAWKEIYAHALQQDYRFLSFGDSSLLFKH